MIHSNTWKNRTICKSRDVISNEPPPDSVASRSETCLCQDGYNCQICRLQQKLKAALTEIADFYHLTEQLFEKYGELPLEDAEDEQVNRGDVERDQEQEYFEEEYAEENEEEEREDEDEDPNALEYAVHRAQTAELANDVLLVDIARLERENKNLRKKLSAQRNSSSSPMTQMTSSTGANPSEADTADGSYSDSGYLKHGRGGKTRPEDAAAFTQQPAGKIAAGTTGKMSRRRGHVETMKDAEKAAKKRSHDTYKEERDDDDDSAEEPSFKRHRFAAKAPARAVEGHKGGQKTSTSRCRPNKLAKKKYHERSDDSDDESFIPDPKGIRSRISRNGGRGSLAPRASQTTTKTGRCTNNSQASFLDTLGLDSLPSGSNNTPAVSGLGSATSNTISRSFDDRSDAAASDTHEATFSTTAAPATTFSTAMLANPPQVATALDTSTTANPIQTTATLTASTVANTNQPGTNLAAVYSTQIAITLAAPTLANTTPAAAANRRTQGWSNTELQALITLVTAHRNAPARPNGQAAVILHDVRLFELMSHQLAAQGIHRSAGACKNEWNRRGRQLSGIDNRKIANPSQMATSLQ